MVFRQHRGQVNVFIVDWAKLAANRYYYTSAKYTKVVGHQLAKFLAFLKESFSVDMDSVHLIGHSLGAHVCGFAGKRLQESGIKVGKITGLDPGELCLKTRIFAFPRANRITTRLMTVSMIDDY